MGMIAEAAAILGLLLFPDVTVGAARGALLLWGRDVVPSLFPYMVFCKMLGKRLGQRGISPGPIALTFGLLGGSPSGAALLSQCGHAIDTRSLLALATVTATISPMFLLNTLNGWLDDSMVCRLLLCAHLIGALTTGALIWKKTQGLCHKLDSPESVRPGTENPIVQSIAAILNVGGCIVVYTVLSSLLSFAPNMPEQAGAVLHAILEIAGGMKSICAAFPPSAMQAVLLAAVSGFGGLSIIAQNHGFLEALGIGKRWLIQIALLKAVLSACAMAALYALFC